MIDLKTSDAILVVDDETPFAKGLARLIQKGFPENQVLIRDSAESALEALAERPVALLITDLRMPGMDGIALIDRALALEPALTVLMLSGFGSAENAVAALKHGAYDFLTKPVDQDALYRGVARGLERAVLMRENARLHSAAGHRDLLPLIGESPAMRRLRDEIEAVAENDYTVLILGESGSGKELVAKNIHRLSKRGRRALVSLNCTAVSDNILESELFGHVRGAFTGAQKASQGLFLAAGGSSLHLDEIGDMPLHLQPKLLRALQEREIRPVGGSESIRTDVRILASTNQPLETRVASGAFRDDLFYRLSVLTIRVPPLRERTRDIPLLAQHFLTKTCAELGKPEMAFTPSALDYLGARAWPGNVRELLNHVRRSAVFSSGAHITETQVRLIDQPGLPTPSGSGMGETYKEARARVVDDFTRSYIHVLLEKTGGNISQAARLSGLERFSLQKILKRLGMDAGAFRGRDD
ncbi:sigma-54 dependent transcriptional regulator [Fundidesulfovibrio butyratiphilus]